jgi:hypothetical protein
MTVSPRCPPFSDRVGLPAPRWTSGQGSLKSTWWMARGFTWMPLLTNGRRVGSCGAEVGLVIQFAAGIKVYLACRPVNMRYGFDGLAAHRGWRNGADPSSAGLVDRGDRPAADNGSGGRADLRRCELEPLIPRNSQGLMNYRLKRTNDRRGLLRRSLARDRCGFQHPRDAAARVPVLRGQASEQPFLTEPRS